MSGFPQVTGVPPARHVKGGAFYGPVGQATVVTRPVNTATYVPIRVDDAVTIQGLNIEVTSAGDVGSVMRLALYSDGGASLGFVIPGGGPNIKIVEPGTVAGDSTGVKAAGITPIQLLPGWYWLAAVNQNYATTATQCRGFSSNTVLDNVNRNAGGGFTGPGFQQAGISGVFPTNVSGVYSTTDTAFILTMTTS